jgi:hypothetical protein
VVEIGPDRTDLASGAAAYPIARCDVRPHGLGRPVAVSRHLDQRTRAVVNNQPSPHRSGRMGDLPDV